MKRRIMYFLWNTYLPYIKIEKVGRVLSHSKYKIAIHYGWMTFGGARITKTILF